MIRNIIAYTVSIVGLLLFLFCCEYHGKLIPCTGAFAIVGIIMFYGGIIISFNIPYINWIANIFKKEMHNLQKHGERITVIFLECEIMVKVGYRWSDIEKIDLLFDTTQAVIIFNTVFHRKPVTFTSPTIDIDRVTLMAKLYMQKRTTIYVDKNNSNLYYFDLEFLYT